MHTRWIETEFDNQIEPFVGTDVEAGRRAAPELVVEVGGRRLEVSLPGDLALGAAAAAALASREAAQARRRRPAAVGDAVTAPMRARS